MAWPRSQKAATTLLETGRRPVSTLAFPDLRETDRRPRASVVTSVPFAASLKRDSHFKVFVGRGAIMHYNSYVPELDLKPVQFECNHQVSIVIIHIPTLKQQTAYVTYLQTDV